LSIVRIRHGQQRCRLHSVLSSSCQRSSSVKCQPHRLRQGLHVCSGRCSHSFEPYRCNPSQERYVRFSTHWIRQPNTTLATNWYHHRRTMLSAMQLSRFLPLIPLRSRQWCRGVPAILRSSVCYPRSKQSQPRRL
jgi:hypothetical protein